MEINKSSRHSKIVGNFGENLICNLLSKSGFESVLVDHTGLDIIAYNQSIGRIGITVKSRTRNKGKEGTSVILFKKNDRQKLLDACNAFACMPWIAIYVETSDYADIYLTSLENYEKYRNTKKTVTDNWGMGAKNKQIYDSDKDVKHIRIDFKSQNWFEGTKRKN